MRSRFASTLIAAAVLLLASTGGSAWASFGDRALPAAQPGSKAPVVLIDSRKCERPEASPYDPFNKTLLRPCALWVVFRQLEMAPGVFTVVAERTKGGLKAKSATSAGSTPENYKIADSILTIRKLMSEFPKSRELTVQLTDRLQELSNWMNTTKLPDEYLEVTGRALLAKASVLLATAGAPNGPVLAYAMQEDVRNKIDFALKQIQPKDSGAYDSSLAAGNLASTFSRVGAKTGNLGEAAQHPSDTLFLAGAKPTAGAKALNANLAAQ